jgi:putative hydrolase of the HAD superfamily
MKLPAAVLFDMDDTILAFDAGLDVDECWRAACFAHLTGNGYHGDLDEVVRAVKLVARWYWSDPERHRTGRLDLRKARMAIIAAAFRKLGIDGWWSGLGLGLGDSDLLGLCDRIAVMYSDARDALVDVYPGAVDTLAHVQKLGIPIALLTNGASLPQRQKIERFGLDRIFKTILVEEEFGIGKPEPEVYLHALRLLDVKAEETWMVGDNYEWEIIAPQSLGIRGIWVNHRGVDPVTLPVQPYRTVRSITELIPLLDDCRS